MQCQGAATSLVKTGQPSAYANLLIVIYQLNLLKLCENVKTERELPPLMTGDGYACKNFSYKDQIFSLHGGIMIDLDTPDPVPMDAELAECYDEFIQSAQVKNNKALDPNLPAQEAYEMPVVEVNGKRFYMMKIDFDTYYPQNPKKPKWLEAEFDRIAELRPKKLPIQEPQMMDVYKKIFGYRRALKFKNIPAGLKVAAQRGLVSIFSELSRKSQMSQLMKQDEYGLSLIHHAAMNNRPQIIAKLILQSMDVNARRNQSVLSIGPTALHLAARCGSLDAVACLCANYANILVIDHNGWAPIHQAAFYNHVPVIKMLVRKHNTLLELITQNEEKNTPMLLAASSGALESVCCLISLGAELLRTNEKQQNLIHLATLRFHTNVLDYFICNVHPGISVWTVLVSMLNDPDYIMQDSAVRCMETLSLANKEYWKAIRDYKGIPALVKLLQSNRPDIQSVAASVLCNISEEDDIRAGLAACGACKILIDLLSSPQDEIQSRAAIIMSDVACVGDNQIELARLGAIPPLITLLESELEDVLVNSVNALRVLGAHNKENQTEIAETGALIPLVEFLSVHDSDILQAAASAALAAICANHEENQNKVREANAIEPLVRLIEARNMTVQVKASSAIEALCTDNSVNQSAFLDYEAPRFLIRLLKIWSTVVKEQGACALWAIAGHTKPHSC
ncbi:ANKAR [Bugula neritina]|uniref:ANKAR n=1 Tax=Bugula neritina TaxID=10212 RepID=A0A7J7KCP5_BUGNE|nr:ANKAR [Bugula neritina]